MCPHTMSHSISVPGLGTVCVCARALVRSSHAHMGREECTSILMGRRVGRKDQCRGLITETGFD